MTAPIELYYWPTPNGWKISIMLEELGVPYKVKYINIGRGEQFAPEFLKIAPNNRMPAIIDPDGPGGEPISVFESGAILQYLGRKFGKFYSAEERTRIQIEEWLFWQVGGLGPMAGQAHHFRGYAPEKIEYGINRYTNEVNRLYGVMNKRLAEREYLAGDYSIADMACIGWVIPYEKQGQDLNEFPNLKRWFETMMARPAVIRGTAIGTEERERSNLAEDKEAQKILFNLSPVMDLSNGEIVAFETARRPVFKLVENMLAKAVSRLQDDERPIPHSDQGWQYQMPAWQRRLQARNIDQSMSRKGNCLDNAAMESFFAILKSEFFYPNDFDSLESLTDGIDDYIHYYNHDRIKLKLKGLSPVQYRTQPLNLISL